MVRLSNGEEVVVLAHSADGAKALTLAALFGVYEDANLSKLTDVDIVSVSDSIRDSVGGN